MSFFSRFIKGLCIGVGSFAPGLSGGTLAVVFDLYDKIMDFIANFYVDFKKKVLFLLPVGIGGVIGFFLFSLAISSLLADGSPYKSMTMSLFIGLIAGSLPCVFGTANKRGFKLRYLIFFIVAFAIAVVASYSFGEPQNAPEALNALGANTNFLLLMSYGLIVGFGTIVPGISSSAILLQCGGYYTVTSAITTLNIGVIFPIGLGFVLGILMFAKLTTFLIKKAYGYTYYTVLGFVTGSIILLFNYVHFAWSLSTLFSMILMIAGFFGTYYLSKLQKT